MASVLSLAVCQESDRTRIYHPIPVRNDNLFNMDESEFIKNFRISKQLAQNLIQVLKIQLEPRTVREGAISVERKVLCALRFFASGAYQRNIANKYICSMTQQSASRCIRQVADAMLSLLPKYIKFPTDTSEQRTIKEGFFQYCGLSGVVGAIDCTHVAIIAPADDGFHNEKNYVNRKNYHSINVQLVCDINLKILNVVARFPGCTHDAYIWRSSSLRRYFEDNNLIHGNGWLLGDSGYPGERWLHVPFASPRTQEEEQYNFAHSRGRSAIERCNGVLKTRFRCLLKHRTLQYQSVMAAKITIACAILHNMCVNNDLTWEDWELPQNDQLFNTDNNE